MSLTVIRLPENPYPVILGQPWMECVDAHVICRRGVLQLGPPGSRGEIPLYTPSQMRAWCKQSEMEVVGPEEEVQGRHSPTRGVEIHQIEEEDESETPTLRKKMTMRTLNIQPSQMRTETM